MEKTHFDKSIITAAMAHAGMIPVFNHSNLEVCINVVKACHEAGLNVFEFTNRGAGAREVFVKLTRFVKDHMEGFILGAGTVMNLDDANYFIENDAAFIISPFLDIQVGKLANDKDMVWIPGCATLTEIMQARWAGAEVIKIFPGNVLGPAFVSSVLGPVPDLQLMPTGGINPTEDELKKWFEAGVVCVGMGSQLFSKDLINSGDFVTLKKNIHATKSIIERIRSKSVTR